MQIAKNRPSLRTSFVQAPFNDYTTARYIGYMQSLVKQRFIILVCQRAETSVLCSKPVTAQLYETRDCELASGSLEGSLFGVILVSASIIPCLFSILPSRKRRKEYKKLLAPEVCMHHQPCAGQLCLVREGRNELPK